MCDNAQQEGVYSSVDGVSVDISDGYLTPVCSNPPADSYMRPTMSQMNDTGGPYTGLLKEHTGHRVQEYESIGGGYEVTESSSRQQPKSICDLTGQKLTAVGKEIFENVNIRTLLLDQNEFAELPVEIYKMLSLECVSAVAQRAPTHSRTAFPALHQIPPGIEKLKKLSHLLLYNNAIVELPDSFSQLQKLSHLDLRLNLISEFPPCLCEMPNLQELHLSGNKIRMLPSHINKMVGLQVLTIDNNDVGAITKELCELKNLNYLSIRHNRLTQLPYNLTQLTGLLPSIEETNQNKQRLHLEGNPLQHPPEEHRESTRKIFDYLKETEDITSTTREPSPPNLPTQRKDASLVQKIKRISVDKVQTPSLRQTAYHPQPHQSEMEINASLTEYMQSHGLVHRASTPSDGNCFFHALADQLKRPQMNLQTYTHEELRANLVDFLQRAPDEIQKVNRLSSEKNQTKEIQQIITWLESVERTTLPTYVNKMSQNGEWADEIAIKTAALMLCRDICIVAQTSYNFATAEGRPSSSIFCNAFKGGEGKALHILLANSHFQSLGLIEEERFTESQTTDKMYDDTSLQPMKVTVDLCNKGLQDLPQGLNKCVETLLLSRNHLTDTGWWHELNGLPKLCSLNLSDQQPHEPSRQYTTLRRVPPDIHYYIPHLRELVLSKNRIDILPTEISYMKSLELLDFVDNHISELPAAICRLPHLQYLGLSSNKLARVPEEIGCLRKLQVLRLSNNQLKELPDSICELSELFCLSLTKNKLEMLPPQLHKLTNLISENVYKSDILLPQSTFPAKLWIEGNEATIQYPTADICHRGTTEIFRYLEHMENKPRERDQIISNIRNRSSSGMDVRPKSCSGDFKHFTDNFLDKLSMKLGREWRSLGIALGIEQQLLDCFEDDYPHNTKQVICRMLYEWRNHCQTSRKSEEKMLNQLSVGLREVGREDLRDKLEKTYKRISQA